MAATTKDLVQRLEEGVKAVETGEDMKRFLSTQARFHTYSWSNVLLILAQRPDASRVAGFHTWLALGRHVRKGERGLAILAPIFPRKDKSRETRETKAPEEEEVGPNPVRFRPVYVFDVSQTEGEPVPEPPIHKLDGESGEARWLLPRLLTLAQAEGLTVDMAATDCGVANGFYRRSDKAIHVAAGLAADQQAKTLAHELGHHLLGHDGHTLDRPQAEVEAEGVAFVVCARAGVATDTYSFGYVATWAGEGPEGEKRVRQALSAIQRTAGAMIDRIEERDPRAEARALVDRAHAIKARVAEAAVER